MGTHCFINVYQTYPDQDLEYAEHLCTIMRTADGMQAYEVLAQAVQDIVVVNGSYTGMPGHEVNGGGRFAMKLLAMIADGWEEYTTICGEVGSYDEIDGDDILVTVYVPFEGSPTLALAAAVQDEEV